MVAQLRKEKYDTGQQNCRFCSFISHKGEAGGPHNVPLCETKNFVVIASLGAIVPGWVLVVPRQHYINFGAVPMVLQDELNQLVESVVSIVERTYGTFTLFEHGPVCDGTGVGCGIDHAHLHVVPVNFEYNDVCRKAGLELVGTQKVEDFSLHRELYSQQKPYLFIKNNSGISSFFSSNIIPSQFFRRVIADNLGVPEMFDYKNHFFMDNVLSTLEVLGPRCKSIHQCY